MSLYTCDTNYNFHVEPITRQIDNATITTWQYDPDSKYFNFEIQWKLEDVKDEFYWSDGSFFGGDFNDYIERIGEVILKDGLMIISGLKEKGN